MAFERKQDGGDNFKFETKGDTLTGYYLGSQALTTSFGDTYKHAFKTEKGVKVVFGQAHLTRLLQDEEPGYLMRVTYEGTKKGKNGSNFKSYALEIDRDQKLDANELAAVPDNNSAYEDGDDLTDEIPPSRATAPAVTRSVPNASAQRSQLDSVLSGTKSRRA